MNNRKIASQRCIAILLLLVSGCDFATSSKDSAGAKPGSAGKAKAKNIDGRTGANAAPISVIAVSVNRIAIADSIEAVGTTLANESITVSAKVTDTVSKVRFADGDIVSKGDVLVELTNTEEQALLGEAEANLEDFRTQKSRLENLLVNKSVPISQVDEARAKFNAAEAKHRSIVARLQDRLIRAPFSGMLGFRQVSPGTLITPGTAITTLDDLSIIKLDFAVSEVYLAQLSTGLAVRAQSVSYPDLEFQADVQTVSSRVDPVTRTASVRAIIVNEGLLLRPGMLMAVKLASRPREALVVPEIALLQQSGEAFVYRVNDQQRVEKTLVEIGQRYQGQVEILAGLEAGALIVTDGIVKMRPNLLVKLGGQNEAGDQ